MEDNESYEVVQKYEPMMHGLLRRFRVRRDYEDILQELRLETWQALKSHNPDKAKLTTFVYKCLKNYLINKLVVEKKNQTVDKEKDMTLKQKIPYNLEYPDYIGELTFEQQMETLKNYNPSEHIRLKIDLELFRNTLDEKDRTIFELRESGLTQKEIADTVKMTRKTIRKRLNFIKERLKFYLEEGVSYGERWKKSGSW